MDGKCWAVVGLFLVAVGCNQSNSGTANGLGSSTPKPSQSTAKSSPDRAVFDFLEAVRTGNDKQAAAMLTPLARQKTTEMEMVVAPPGSPTAKFKVGKFEYVTPEKDGAHVWSSWTDVVDGEGHTRTDDIIWVLHLESEGWRIAGMVTKVFPDQPPLVLNFEDPEDMLRKQQLLQQGDSGQSAEGQQPPNQPAGQPQSAGRTDTSLPTTR